jgi:hypothetical protein
MKATAHLRRIVTLAGAVAALSVLAPAAAHADQIGWGGTVLPGTTQCFARYAGPGVYQLRAEGDATRMGARFRLKYNGNVIDATPSDRVTRYSAERRAPFFPGPGTYEICAANHYSTNTLVNLRILFNSEFV